MRRTPRHGWSGGGFGGFGLRGGLDVPPLTRVLLGLLVGLTFLFVWVEPVQPWLAIHPNTLPGLRLTGLVANTFVATPSSLFGFVIFMAIGALIFQHQVRALWHQRRNDVIFGVLAVLAVGWVFNQFVLRGHGWGLAVEVILIGAFGGTLERMWGRRRMLQLVALVVVGTNLLGALLLWGWPGVVRSAVGQSATLAYGAGALIDALLAAWCLRAGRQRLALLNIEARHLVWVLVAINALDVLFTSRLAGLMGLCAIGLTWLWMTGSWRPELLLDRLKLWRLERRHGRTRGRFDVIPGGRSRGGRGRTFH